MRILYCTNQLNVHGGIERILSQKINSLIEDFGHEVHLITYIQKSQNPVYELNKNLSATDLSIDYDVNKSYYHPNNLAKAFQHFFKLKAAIKRIKPDIVISISFTPDQYFIPFLSKKIPKIKELHSSGVVVSKSANKSKGFVKVLKNKLTDIFSKYDALVLLNKDETTYFSDVKTYVISNFTDLVPISNVQKEKTIIAAGRISDVKNFQELAIIWESIHEKFPDWKIKIFGDGDKSSIDNLQNLIDDLKINATFKVFPSTDKIQLELQKASIYAMTSLTECFPMVLLEAQVCGLPIISYDCPNGPRNIINNNSDGFLIENSNRIMFAEKLSSLMQNEDLRLIMSENSKKNVLNFNKKTTMHKWNDLFLKLTKINYFN